MVETWRTLFVLPNTDVAFGLDLGKASLTQIIGSSLLSRDFVIQSFQGVSWKGSHLGHLVCKEDKKKRWNWHQMAICLSRSPLHPSSPCPVPQKPDFYEQPWQAPLPSGFWWGRQWEELAFCRWEQNEFGYLFPWLPACRGILVAVCMQLPSLGFSHHSPPLPLRNSDWPPLPGTVSSGVLYYLLLVPSSACSFVKSLELLPSDYSVWVCLCFLLIPSLICIDLLIVVLCYHTDFFKD